MVDMDHVLCDFTQAYDYWRFLFPKQIYPQSRCGFWSSLRPIDGAIEGFQRLEQDFDVWILTRPSVYNLNSYTEKAQWIEAHLGFSVLERTILCCDKSRIKGDYLIDDSGRDGQPEFEGEWIQFGSSEFPFWSTVVDYILKKEGKTNG